MRRFLPLLLAPLLSLSVSCAQESAAPPPTKPIPALTADQRTQLAECRDFRHSFDEGPLYALLGAAVRWPRDAFGGATPLSVVEKVNPANQERTRELGLLENPASHRGEAMLIEGVLSTTQEGVPNNVGGQLSRPEPQWGATLDCWVIRIGRTERDPQVLVYFPTDGRPLPNVRPGNRVRVAARFYKVFTAEEYDLDRRRNPDPVQAGRESQFVAFVGGAAQVMPDTVGLGSLGMASKLVLLMVFIAIGFGGMVFVRSYMKSMSRDRNFKSPAERWAERLEREREEGVPEDEDDDMELPEDPAAALEKLGGAAPTGQAGESSQDAGRVDPRS